MSKYEDARVALEESIHALLKDSGVTLWQEKTGEHIGPLGGASNQVYGAIEVGGEPVAFMVNIYADPVVDTKVIDRVEASKALRSLRKGPR